MNERLHYDGPTAADGPGAISAWIESGGHLQESVQGAPEPVVPAEQLEPAVHVGETVSTEMHEFEQAARDAVAEALSGLTTDDVELAGGPS